MNLNYGVFHSSYRHNRGNIASTNSFKVKDFKKTVLKNETFAFQIMLSSNEEFLCTLGKGNNISYKGLINKIRVDIDASDYANLSLVDYISDDLRNYLTDIISNEKSRLVSPNISQMIWVKGKVPNDFKGENISFNINLYYSREYDSEVLIGSIPCSIKVVDYSLMDMKDSPFYLDLWQHPTSLARHYEVEIWSDDHFYIIENFIEELSLASQRVITIIASDFPWGGQSCFNFHDNPSNLFEQNIVGVSKNKNGELILDFTALDRYIDICFKHGINREINLFGLIGNWNGKTFKSPLYPEYKDPMRISYFDEGDSTIKYINNTLDLHEYISLLLNHFIEKGYMDITRIFCDEPNDAELFETCVEFINSCAPNTSLRYKCAIHRDAFFKKFENNITDLSLIIPMVSQDFEKFEDVRLHTMNNGGTCTWYVCCFPEIPNQFISSPPIESRLVGWLTYMFKLNGFLRWNYCLYPGDVFNSPSYKYPEWKAGDMFFVYPGKNMKPMSSIRWENMKIGIEEYTLIKILEEKGITYDEIYNDIISPITGHIHEMNGDCRSFNMNHALDYTYYELGHEKLITLLNERLY